MRFHVVVLACSMAALFGAEPQRAPGSAEMVVQNGRVLHLQTSGIADLKTGEPITAHTNFRLASVTKQFTAMAILLLVHDGRLRYDERLTDVFPEFPAFGRQITLRNLLNHTSGLQDYEDLMDQQHWDPARQIEDAQVLDLIEHTSGTKFPPGTRFSYSNSGYVILGLVVAKAAGIPFGDFLHWRIFVPLGMSNTIAYVKGRNEVAHRAYGYSKEGDGWRETDQDSTSATLGDGGVYSSLDDLAKWYRALDQNTLLSAAEIAPAFTPVDLPPGAIRIEDLTVGYGFGWAIDTLDGVRRYWHHGETIGFRASVQRFPDRRLAVVVLQNHSEPDPFGAATELARKYLRRLPIR